MSLAAKFLALTIDRRALAIEQAATTRGIDPVLIEKDFWVCWLLAELFSNADWLPHLVFKGGTSLSKAHRVIERFSEDVDLSLSPKFVGADPAAFEALTSRTRRDEAIVEMQRLCGVRVHETIAPMLEARLRLTLGQPARAASWLSAEPDDAASPNLYFHYPSVRPTGFEYIQRSVKLEFGSLTDQQPVGRHPIRPWLADAFPVVFDDWQCVVAALELERTFWEKATILHSEYHRPAHEPTPNRYSRHYADMASLLDHPRSPEMLADTALCARVATWKSRVFARAWARYDLARHGTFRLAPPSERHAALRDDYATMRPMFMSEPPPFVELVRRLEQAEQTMNRMASA